MSFFSTAELKQLRQVAEDAMDVTGTLREPGVRTWDTNTGRDTFAVGAVRYTGLAAIRPVRPARVVEVGETERPYRQATLHLPHTVVLPRRDDTWTVDNCPNNPALNGEVFRVDGVAFDSDHVSWTLTIEHVAASRVTRE